MGVPSTTGCFHWPNKDSRPRTLSDNSPQILRYSECAPHPAILSRGFPGKPVIVARETSITSAGIRICANTLDMDQKNSKTMRRVQWNLG